MPRLRVYLAGPISGCNEQQKHAWREEARTRLGADFDLEDPTSWVDDRVITREIDKLANCDLVLANMWKESIGTTIGILRAIERGTPVVLVDPNHIGHPLLTAIVRVENVVDSVEKGCARIKELARSFREFQVRKRKDGHLEPFDQNKLVASVKKACAEARVDDAMFIQRITGSVLAQVRRIGGERGEISSTEIRDLIFDELERVSAETAFDVSTRKKAQDVVAAWRRKVELEDQEEVVQRAKEEAERARLDAEMWKERFAALRRKLDECEAVARPQPGGEAPGPRFRSVDQVIREIRKRHEAYLFVHEKALGSAKDLKLKSKGLEALYETLDRLGRFMYERACAAADGEREPTFDEWFGDRYAPTESHETKERYRSSPLVTYRGRPYYGLQHLKLKEDGKTVRIYFDGMPDGRLLISSICRHRPTYSQSG